MTAKFVQKLFRMITDEDSSIIEWSDDGTFFDIRDRVRFQTELLGKYYRHHKLTSFQRQLNFYNFRIVDSSIPSSFQRSTVVVPEKIGICSSSLRYFREFFHRDYPQELMRIRRNTAGSISSLSSSPSSSRGRIKREWSISPEINNHNHNHNSAFDLNFTEPQMMKFEGFPTSPLNVGGDLTPKPIMLSPFPARGSRSVSMSYAEELLHVDPYALSRSRTLSNFSDSSFQEEGGGDFQFGTDMLLSSSSNNLSSDWINFAATELPKVYQTHELPYTYNAFPERAAEFYSWPSPCEPQVQSRMNNDSQILDDPELLLALLDAD